MSKLFIIASYNFRDIISRGFFKVSTLVISLLIILLSILPDFIVKLNFMSNTNNEYLIYIIDEDNYIFDNDLDLNIYSKSLSDYLSNSYYFKLAEKDLKVDDVLMKLKEKDIDGYIEIKDDNQISIVTNEDYPEIKFILDRYIISKHNKVNYPLYEIESKNLTKSMIIDVIKNYTYPLVLMMFIYTLFIIYGQFLALNFNVDKNSKIIDIFLTKVKLPTIILGKLFGVLLAGLLQIIYFLGILFLVVGIISSEHFPLIKEIVRFDFVFICRYILYFVLGFLMYGLLFMLVGSLVSKVEELSIGVVPIVFLISVGYFCAIINLQFPDNYLQNILIYVPFLTPFIWITNSEFIVYRDILIVLAMLTTIIILVWVNTKVIRRLVKFKGIKLNNK